MGEIRTQDKRDKLRLIYAKTPAGGTDGGKKLLPTLMDALTLCDAAINGAVPGTFLSATTEDGGSSSFQMLASFSPVDAKRLIGELIDLYEFSLTKVDDETSDAEIFADMMARLKAIRKFRTDF